MLSKIQTQFHRIHEIAVVIYVAKFVTEVVGGTYFS